MQRVQIRAGRARLRGMLGGAVALVLGVSLLSAAPAAAGTATPAAATPVATASLPEIVSTTSPQGFVHPGIGVTAAQLQNTRQQVNAGVEPWASYFSAMTKTKYASKSYTAQNQGADDQPKDDAYDKVGMRSRALDDSIGALTQSLMYALTGDEVYRANALHVLRSWSGLDPAKYAYFPDAHIHTGVPLYYFVTAAELIRSTKPVHDSLDGYDLRWTDRDQQRAADNLVRPTLDTFLFSQNRLWNQHTYGVVGMIAAAIFLDDADLYAQRVEWFSVNSTYQSEHTINGGDVNGGLASLIRMISADDPLNTTGKDFVELVEMERDQAHAEGDITTLSAAARMISNQGTRLDPVHGTVSAAADAVSPYGFLDNRLLKGANAFAQFMMGSEPPFIDPSGGASTLSQAYRGRLRELMNDLYYQYTYVEGVDVASVAPWVAKLHEQSDGPLYYYGSGIENFWNPRGSDFTDSEYWVAFPPQLASQNVQVPAPASSAVVSPVRYGTALGAGAKVLTDDEGAEIARLNPQKGDAAVALRRMVWGDTRKTSLVGIRVRTNGTATLDALGTAQGTPFAQLSLPDTGNRWTWVWVDLDQNLVPPSAVGANILFLRATGDASKVDIGGVLSDATSTLTPPKFADSPSLGFVAVSGEPIARRLAVTDADSTPALSLQSAPKGAAVAADGTLSWTPPSAGSTKLLVVADDGEATTTLPVTITVAADRTAAIAAVQAGLAEPSAYTSETWGPVAAAADAARDGIASDSATFAGLLENLRIAVCGLVLLNPHLADGTLDYSRIVTSGQLTPQVLGALVDGSNSTTWGDRRDKTVDLDFGAGYRVRADRFGLLARDTFPNRSQGTNVYGSDDGRTWTLLTEHPNAGRDDQIEYLDVKDAVKDQRFRYIRLQLDEPGIPTDPAYPGIWTQADFHIDGVRSEATLADVLAEADAIDSSAYSRASRLLFSREIDAIRTAAQKPDADQAALTARALAAWDLLEPPVPETVAVQPAWVTASTRSWDGKRDAAGNGWAMFDGDPATYTDTTSSSGWVSVIPPDGTPLTVAAIGFTPRAGYTSRAVGVQFQGSTDDGHTWTTFATVGSATEGPNRVTLDAPMTMGAFRVYAPSGNTNLAEVSLISTSVDHSGLRLLLDETAGLTEQDWTASSWTSLADARAAGSSVLADASADQATVDSAATRIADARAQLVAAG